MTVLMEGLDSLFSRGSRELPRYKVGQRSKPRSWTTEGAKNSWDDNSSGTSVRTVRTSLFVILRGLYGGIFILAGLLKLTDLHGFEGSIRAFALFPEAIVPALKILIPCAELVLGIAIAAGVFVAISARLLLGFLVTFTAVTATKVTEGAEISCGCFGSLDDGTIGFITIVRNLALILGAIFFAIHPGIKRVEGGRLTVPSSPEWLLFRRACNYTATTLLAVTAFTLALQNRSMKSSLSILNAELNALKAGEVAQEFTAQTLNGSDTTIAFRGSQRTILFVMKSSCRPCELNLEGWRSLATSCQSSGGAVLAVSMDSPMVAQEYVTKHGLRFPVLSASNGNFRIRYKVVVTPHTILLDGDRVVEVRRGELSPDDVHEIAAYVGELPSAKGRESSIIRTEKVP